MHPIKRLRAKTTPPPRLAARPTIWHAAPLEVLRLIAAFAPTRVRKLGLFPAHFVDEMLWEDARCDATRAAALLLVEPIADEPSVADCETSLVLRGSGAWRRRARELDGAHGPAADLARVIFFARAIMADVARWPVARDPRHPCLEAFGRDATGPYVDVILSPEGDGGGWSAGEDDDDGDEGEGEGGEDAQLRLTWFVGDDDPRLNLCLDEGKLPPAAGAPEFYEPQLSLRLAGTEVVEEVVAADGHELASAQAIVSFLCGPRSFTAHHSVINAAGSSIAPPPEWRHPDAWPMLGGFLDFELQERRPRRLSFQRTWSLGGALGVPLAKAAALAATLPAPRAE
jgi:hypothetical protein